MKRPASQAAILQEQGSEIRPGFSGWLKVKAENIPNKGISKVGGARLGLSWWLAARSKLLITQVDMVLSSMPSYHIVTHRA